VATHARFGAGSGADVAGLTKVFRSSDRGQSWSLVATLDGILRASLFVHNGALHLLGAEAEGKPNVIRRSYDNGATWSTPTGNTSGMLERGGLGTPNNPVLFAGRIWSGATRRVFSAPLAANLLWSGSWTLSPDPGSNPAWLDGAFVDMTEGQVVASPEQGVVVLPKVRALPYTALVRVDPAYPDVVSFDPERDFVPLPGGEKKFGAAHDPQSGRFFVLGNPVLPAHASHPTLGGTPELIRNTAAVLSSPDLRAWRVEKIFLYTANLAYEGFQYFNFAIAGDDLLVASRTAFAVGGNRPPRAHDANLLTFHRIAQFRDLRPDHYLALDPEGDSIRRHERTQHADAPLGTFPLGAGFAGQSLSRPAAFGQAADGDVYVQEATGRVLRFDAAGNFIGTVTAAPVALQAQPLTVRQPPVDACSWVASGSGDWREPLNWYYWNRPDTAGETAIFGSAITAPATVLVRGSDKGWFFARAGDTEGWRTTDIDAAVVQAGQFAGVAATGDPWLYRTGQQFSGARFNTVKVRMRAAVTGPARVDLYWGDTDNDVFAEARRASVQYTGAGAFQEVVFNLAGNPLWDGRMITRIRVDPLNGAAFAGRALAIDAIVIADATPAGAPAKRIGGLRFRSGHGYTLAGSGTLCLDPPDGPGRITVEQGAHAIHAPLVFAGSGVCEVAPDAVLTLRAQPQVDGEQLELRGGGAIAAPDWTLAAGQRLTVAAGATLTLDADVRVGSGATLELRGGTLLAGGLELAGAGAELVIGGAAAGAAAPLCVAGDIRLVPGSRLAVDIAAATRISPGDDIVLVVYAGAVEGTFEHLEEGALLGSGGAVFRLAYADRGAIRLIRVAQSYAQWTDWHGLSGPGAAPPADPAGDGVANLVKYMLGVAPDQAIPGGWAPPVTLANMDDGPHLVLAWDRDPAATGVVYTWEYSADLVNWLASPVALVVDQDSPERHHASMPLTGPDAGFFRLVLSMPETVDR
jgi:hypothetical protein